MATLINGNGNLAIYAQQDADWYAALMGGQTVITAVGNQFAYELLDANTIGVKDGVIITTEGRRIQLDANAIDSFDIPTGAQGTTNYYIIGYHLVTGDLSEQTCETFVQLMENGTDTIPEGSFRDGDDEVFVSLYRVEQNDLTLGTITLLLPELSGSFQSQITELNNDLSNELIASQLVSGSKNFTLPTGKRRLLCITKKSNVIVETKEVPVSALNVNDVIPLGDTSPIIYNKQISGTYATAIGKEVGAGIGQGATGATGHWLTDDGGGAYTDIPGVNRYSIASDASNAISATITRNSSDSFTITVTDATLSVYVY